MKKTLSLATLILSSSFAFAGDNTFSYNNDNIYIEQVGALAESTGVIHFDKAVNTGHESYPECPWNNLYLDLTTHSGREILSIAKMAMIGKYKVARISYNLDTNGNCRVDELRIK